MSVTQDMAVGLDSWSFVVRDDQHIDLLRAPFPEPRASPTDLTREALEKPFAFEPLRRALTPDDRITLVLDPNIPKLGVIITEVFTHLASAGVNIESVTVLTPPGTSDSWLEAIPEEFDNVRTEVHDPEERKKLAYLASTAGGRRLYLNRTLVEADFIIVVSACGYDPLSGYSGAVTSLFPVLSDTETRAAFAGELHVRAPGDNPWPVRAEATEVVSLLGMPFFVQVVEGRGDTVQEIVAGLSNSCREAIRKHDLIWRCTVAEEPDTVIVAVGGDPSRITFLEVAKAAACAARVAKKGGRIAILTDSAPPLGDGARLLRSMDGPNGARRLLEKEKPSDWAAAYLWAFAAKHHSLFLASRYPDDLAEELFATPLHSAIEAQRLIDSSSRVLLIPDAHKTMVTVE
jgi:nickel-dependent lactate racemase